MKWFGAVFSLVIGLSFSAVCPSSEQAIFDQAVELSKSGDFGQAIDLYKKLPESYSVNLNIASCYFCMSDFAQSLLFLKKAAKHASVSQRAKLSVLIDQARLKLGLSQAPLGFWAKFKKYAAEGFFVVSGISLIWLELLVFGLWILLLFFIKRGSGRASRFSAVSLFTLCLGLFLAVNFNQNSRRGIVVCSSTQMFSGPGKDFAAIGKAERGLECSLKRQSGDFVRVAMGKKKGWIRRSDIAEI